MIRRHRGHRDLYDRQIKNLGEDTQIDREGDEYQRQI